MNKRIIAALLTAASLTAALFAADVEFSGSNELSTEIVAITTGDNGGAEFTGIENATAVEFTSERFDAALDISLFFGLESATKANGEEYKFAGLTGYEFNDYYIEFRPVSILTLGFHDSISTAGSYLPVADGNLSNGNIGSDFVLVLRPIEGLRIAAGMDLNSYFGKEETKPTLNFGLDYAFAEMFTFGVSARNVIDDFAFGAFISFTGLEGLVLNAGYSMKDEGVADVTGNLFALGASYELDALSLAFDFASNFGADGADLYTALCAGYSINDAMNVSLAASFVTDFDDSDAKVITIAPNLAYTNGNNEFNFGACVEIASATKITFPVSWKYNF